MNTRIVCAANRFSDGTVVLGARHWDHLMHSQVELLLSSKWVYGKPKGREEQGFIDQRGNFYSREEALLIARQSNQIVRRCGNDENELFSENLY